MITKLNHYNFWSIPNPNKNVRIWKSEPFNIQLTFEHRKPIVYAKQNKLSITSPAAVGEVVRVLDEHPGVPDELNGGQTGSCFQRSCHVTLFNWRRDHIALTILLQKKENIEFCFIRFIRGGDNNFQVSSKVA